MTQRPELTPDEMEAETAAALPDREAMSLLDLTANLDLALDLSAPIDAAVAANALSFDSTAQALADQDSAIVQNLDGVANATANQDATIEQGEA